MVATGRRKNTRVKFYTTATASFNKSLYKKCELKDLSTGGVFIYGITSQQKGDLCSLTLQLTGAAEDIVVQVKGEVVRVTGEGAGINFHEIDIDSLAHLKNIIYYNTPDPDDLTEGDLAWIPPKNR